MKTIKVSQLYTYPVKSAAGSSQSRLRFDAMGPQFDRRWMVVDDKGLFQTQRKYPRMCQIGTSIEGSDLILSAPGMSPLRIGNTQGQAMSVTVWRDSVIASDCGDEAAKWLSDYMHKQCRLVYFGDDAERMVARQFAHNDEQVGFADAFPILLISEASLQFLNSKMTDPVLMDRFRPNIVVSGCPAHAEDQWHKINIGEVDFTVVSPCSRCVVPSIDQQTAVKNAQILDVLREYRMQGAIIYFAMNAVHHGLGDIGVGDQVTVRN
jgi:uncharacterized protein YcbX